MHDLVHDLARSVASDKCSIVDPSSSNETLSQNSRYASFICDEKSQSASLLSLHDAKKLRTLYIHKHILFIQNVNEVLHVISSNVNLLRALHLKYCPLKTLPDSFKKLKHLRYLDHSRILLDSFPPCISTLHSLKTLNLSQTNIESIPDSIGNLCNLSTLDLGYCSHLSSLPESICALSNLHPLTLTNCYLIQQLPQNICNINRLVHLNIHKTQLTFLPRRLGKLSQLRTLPIFICGGKTDCSLAELSSLKLEGELQIKALQRVTSVDEVKVAHLNEMCGIRILNLIYQAKDVLQNLQSHNNLKELEIQCHVGRSFLQWILSLSNLARLTQRCCKCEKLSALGQLPQLEYLHFIELPLIKQLSPYMYMTEVVATSLLSFVSDQLESKAHSEFALLTGAEEELRKLERTLSTIQHVLEDAETKQVKDRALRSWLKKLKDLAYDADDVCHLHSRSEL
ncbi:putative disease resistance protein RGA4 [Platanthera guangdongensis]|uniref:Disease resistance protein RGA4 n=1 Tax=Platanthera guangdongensis TaxID=2320717 RepID=A0ABR2M7T8_9ASPA